MHQEMVGTSNTLPSESKLALFLDIDGILHSASKSIELHTKTFMQTEKIRMDLVDGKKSPHDYGLLDIEKQMLLAEMLERHPDVVVIISSAWRCWEGNVCTEVENLLWLKSMLHPTIAQRISGKTPVPDTDLKNWQSITRLDEIREFMHESADALKLCKAWVAIDDQARHFPAEMIQPFFHEDVAIRDYCSANNEYVVLVNGEKGLTELSVRYLEAAITRALASSRDNASLKGGQPFYLAA